jgi:hypothetical protein
MSFLTPQPAMSALVSSSFTVRFIAGGHLATRATAQVWQAIRRVRRRNGKSGDSPMEIRLNHRGV